MHLLQNSRGAHQDKFLITFTEVWQHCTMTNTAWGMPTQCTAQTDAPGKYALSVVYVVFPYILSESLSLLSNFLSEAYTCIYIFMCTHTRTCVYIYSWGEGNWPKIQFTQDWIPLHSLFLFFSPVPGTISTPQVYSFQPKLCPRPCLCLIPCILLLPWPVIQTAEPRHHQCSPFFNSKPRTAVSVAHLYSTKTIGKTGPRRCCEYS